MGGGGGQVGASESDACTWKQKGLEIDLSSIPDPVVCPRVSHSTSE